MSHVASAIQVYLQRGLGGLVAMEERRATTDHESNFWALDLEAQARQIDEIILGGVLCSEAFVLLLTPTVLLRVHTLLATYEAIVHKLPVVTVLVERSGYDFSAASDTLRDLKNQLDRVHGEGS